MIKVTDDYIVLVDERNYTVCQNKPYISIDKKTGRETTVYPPVGYYGTLENAISAIRERTIRDNLKDANMSLTEAVQMVRKVTADFQQILNDAMKGEPANED